MLENRINIWNKIVETDWHGAHASINATVVGSISTRGN